MRSSLSPEDSDYQEYKFTCLSGLNVSKRVVCEPGSTFKKKFWKIHKLWTLFDQAEVFLALKHPAKFEILLLKTFLDRGGPPELKNRLRIFGSLSNFREFQ